MAPFSKTQRRKKRAEREGAPLFCPPCLAAVKMEHNSYFRCQKEWMTHFRKSHGPRIPKGMKGLSVAKVKERIANEKEKEKREAELADLEALVIEAQNADTDDEAGHDSGDEAGHDSDDEAGHVSDND